MLLSPGSTTCERQTVLDLSLFVQRHGVICYQFLRLNVKPIASFHAWKDSGYYSDRRENLKHRKNQEARALSFRESFVSVCGVWTRGVHMWKLVKCGSSPHFFCQEQETVPFLYFCTLDWVLQPTTEGFPSDFFSSTFGSTKVLKMFPVAFYTSRCIKMMRFFSPGKTRFSRFFGAANKTPFCLAKLVT